MQTYSRAEFFGSLFHLGSKVLPTWICKRQLLMGGQWGLHATQHGQTINPQLHPGLHLVLFGSCSMQRSGDPAGDLWLRRIEHSQEDPLPDTT